MKERDVKVTVSMKRLGSTHCMWRSDGHAMFTVLTAADVASCTMTLVELVHTATHQPVELPLATSNSIV